MQALDFQILPLPIFNQKDEDIPWAKGSDGQPSSPQPCLPWKAWQAITPKGTNLQGWYLKRSKEEKQKLNKQTRGNIRWE